MLKLSRRSVLVSAALAAALGLEKRLAIAAQGDVPVTADPSPPFHTYKVGDIEVTAIYDGIWEKPHDAAFFKNASVEETKEALAKAGMTADFVSIPLTVVVLKIGGKYVMVDSGTGGQWKPTAGKLAANMKAAGIDPAAIGTILISHFHPDHIYGLMEKDTNRAIYPNAELVVSATEYTWWTEPGRVEKLPEARKALGNRIQSVFPTWKNFRLVEGEAEVAPGVRLVSAPGHTPGHSAFHVSSGAAQMMLACDVVYLPALVGPHPGWQGAYDQDGPTAVETRRKLLERVIAEEMAMCGAHFPFPAMGTFAKDGDGYVLTPAKA